MSDTLVTWPNEPDKNESWAEILGADNDAELHAYNRAAAEEAQKQAADPDLYTISEAELLKRWKVEAEKLESVTLNEARAEAARQFMTEAPEVADTVQNGERLGQYFQAAGLRGDSPDDFHRAYKALASRGLIAIEEDRRPRTPRKHLGQDPYELPMAELEALARGNSR
jgi:hypothetical protein